LLERHTRGVLPNPSNPSGARVCARHA
jgi:hypothetical protein